MTWHFPDRTIKVKLQKSHKDTYVLPSPKAYAISIVLDCSRNCFCSCELLCSRSWLNFTPLLLLSDKAGCATFKGHTCRAWKLVIDKTFVQNRTFLLPFQLQPALFQGWVYFTPLLLRSSNPACALFEVHTFWARLLVFKEIFVRTVFAVVHCAIVGLRMFYSLVLSCNLIF